MLVVCVCQTLCKSCPCSCVWVSYPLLQPDAQSRIKALNLWQLIRGTWGTVNPQIPRTRASTDQIEEEFLGHGIGPGNSHARQVYPEINLQRVNREGGTDNISGVRKITELRFMSDTPTCTFLKEEFLVAQASLELTL